MKKNDSGINPWMFVILGIALVFIGGTVMKDMDAPILEGIDLHLGKLVSNMGIVLIWIQGIKKFFYEPLSEAIQNRTKELESTYSEAENVRSEMNQMKSEYEARLAKTEAEAREQIQAQVRSAQEFRQKLMDEANDKAADLMKKAEENIAQERDKVLNELRVQMVGMTLQATQKLIDKNVDNDVNKNLVEEYIKELEVANL